MRPLSAAKIDPIVNRLPNGLTIIAHRDPKAPVAAVYVAYRAGSREEPPGMAGLAHLAEHLMYTGTSKMPGSYFRALEHLGATSINAFVHEDFSAYFQTVPVVSVDSVLRMEADRMIGMADSLREDTVEREREIIRQELKQRELDPVYRATRILPQVAYPHDHVYAHPRDGLIGEIASVGMSATSEWIRTRHIAAHALLVVAGDVQPDVIFDSAAKHFKDAPADESCLDVPALNCVSPAARRVVVEMQSLRDCVCTAWYLPTPVMPDPAALEFACELVLMRVRSGLAKELSSSLTLLDCDLRPTSGGLSILFSASAPAPMPADSMESELCSVLGHLARESPSEEEIDYIRSRLLDRVLRQTEPVGGAWGKAGILALATMLDGTALAHNARIDALGAATSGDVSRCAGFWNAAPRFTVQIRGVARR